MPATEQELLNPKLYRRLVERFTDVRITNQGEHATPRLEMCWKEGKPRPYTTYTGGEHYYTNCPSCRDSHQRLSFSHLYNTRDPVTGAVIDHLVHCFNEDCYADPQARRSLFDRLTWPCRRTIAQRPTTAPPSTRPSGELPPCSLSTCSVPLEDLPSDHPAAKYLRSRGFSAVQLSLDWEASYVENDETTHPHIQHSILIPIYGEQTITATCKPDVAGWQARAVEPRLTRLPKYLFSRGLPKSQLLYGLREAIRIDGPVVLVEGVFDVWRLGPGAIASFGNKLSAAQATLIASNFRNRPVMIGYDADAAAEAVAARQRLVKLRGEIGDSSPVLICPPPQPCKDFGECRVEVGWRAIHEVLATIQKPVLQSGSEHYYSANVVPVTDDASPAAVVYPPFNVARQYRGGVVAHLRENGFVRTLHGRRRRLPDIESSDPALVAKAERQAVNAVIQGTAAEVMKAALVRVHHSLPAGCHLVLTVHDSAIVECPIEQELAVRELLHDTMISPPVSSWFPLAVTIKSGYSWGKTELTSALIRSLTHVRVSPLRINKSNTPLQ